MCSYRLDEPTTDAITTTPTTMHYPSTSSRPPQSTTTDPRTTQIVTTASPASTPTLDTTTFESTVIDTTLQVTTSLGPEITSSAQMSSTEYDTTTSDTTVIDTTTVTIPSSSPTTATIPQGETTIEASTTQTTAPSVATTLYPQTTEVFTVVSSAVFTDTTSVPESLSTLYPSTTDDVIHTTHSRHSSTVIPNTSVAPPKPTIDVKTATSHKLLLIIPPVCSVIVVLICVFAIGSYARRQRARNRRGEGVVQMSAVRTRWTVRNDMFSITTDDEDEEQEAMIRDISARPSAPQPSVDESPSQSHHLTVVSVHSDAPPHTPSPETTPKMREYAFNDDDISIDTTEPSFLRIKATSTPNHSPRPSTSDVDTVDSRLSARMTTFSDTQTTSLSDDTTLTESRNPSSAQVTIVEIHSPTQWSPPSPPAPPQPRMLSQQASPPNLSDALDLSDIARASNAPSIMSMQSSSSTSSPPNLSAVSERTESTGASSPPSLLVPIVQTPPPQPIDPAPPEFICHLCQKSCKSRAGLHSHLRRHERIK